jgi:hypothetical protein
MEIGSEFWLDNIPTALSPNEIPNWLTKLGDTVLTSSGRGAITLLLQQVTPQNKSVLLPAYTCDSVILPFIEQGYSCYFYDINEDLSPNIESIKSYKNIGLFFHMGYYGFSTNSNLLNVVLDFRKQSTIIVEDITHTLFSSYKRLEENDFLVGSIRKWFGIPGGGFLASSTRKLKRPQTDTIEFLALRKAALYSKGKYIKNNDNNLKMAFLNQFSEAESLLDKDPAPYRIDSLSNEIINSFNIADMVRKRRQNFVLLSEGLRNVSYLNVLFSDFPDNVCPIFYPVIIKKDRNDVRRLLIDEKIYCPVHWPIPDKVKCIDLVNSLGIYSEILSIPCDQRYGEEEMARIISVLNRL